MRFLFQPPKPASKPSPTEQTATQVAQIRKEYDKIQKSEKSLTPIVAKGEIVLREDGYKADALVTAYFTKSNGVCKIIAKSEGESEIVWGLYYKNQKVFFIHIVEKRREDTVEERYYYNVDDSMIKFEGKILKQVGGKPKVIKEWSRPDPHNKGRHMQSQAKVLFNEHSQAGG
jgi:hypothetical protein